MLETLVVLVLIGALTGVGALLVWVPWVWTFGVGLGVLALGTAVGVPTGFWYHVRLRRAFLDAGHDLPARWWWNPTPLHRRLSESELEPVLPSFYAGAAGWVAMVAGCILAVAGLFRSPYL